MRKTISILLSLLMVFSLCAVSASADSTDYQVVSCPEQNFSTICNADYFWNYSQRDGITIYTEHEGSIPYVLIYTAEDWIVEAGDYIREQYTPHMKEQYGENLVSYDEYDAYTIGGKTMAVGLYTYRLQGYLIDMIRAYDVVNGHTVIYTAKYIQGQGDATLETLDLVAANYRPYPDYYSASFDAGNWRYMTTSTSSGDTIYIFDEVFVAIPASWAGKYDVVMRENGVSFYHSMSRFMWQNTGGFEGGLLFTLSFSDTQDYADYLPSYQDIGPGANGYYYLIFPTDLQAYAEIDSIRSEYMSMWADIGFVRDNSYSFIFHTQPITG